MVLVYILTYLTNDQFGTFNLFRSDSFGSRCIQFHDVSPRASSAIDTVKETKFGTKVA